MLILRKQKLSGKANLTIFESRNGTMKYTRAFLFIFSFIAFSLCTQPAMAQMVASPEPFDNGAGAASAADGSTPVQEDGPPDPCVGPDANCPIDGGVVLLIAAGVGLAGKRAYKLKKEKANSPAA